MTGFKSGGWTAYSCDITEDDLKVFNEALIDLKDVVYSPVAIATQVVSGIKYSFFCNAEVINPSRSINAAIIDIHQPPGRSPYIIEIRLINP